MSAIKARLEYARCWQTPSKNLLSPVIAFQSFLGLFPHGVKDYRLQPKFWNRPSDGNRRYACAVSCFSTKYLQSSIFGSNSTYHHFYETVTNISYTTGYLSLSDLPRHWRLFHGCLERFGEKKTLK